MKYKQDKYRTKDQVFSVCCDDYWLVVGLNNGLAKVFVISTGQLLAELDCKGAVCYGSIVFNFTESWSYSFLGIGKGLFM